jgi:hypothetical protein
MKLRTSAQVILINFLVLVGQTEAVGHAALADDLVHDGRAMTAPILAEDGISTDGTLITIEGDAALALYNNLTANSVSKGVRNVTKRGKNILCRTSPYLECEMRMDARGEITPFN